VESGSPQVMWSVDGLTLTYPVYGYPAQVLVSTNLLDWAVLTNIPPNGQVIAQDPEAATLPQRFYKLELTP